MSLKTKGVAVNIPATSFPSNTATDAEKASPEYGLKIGQAIQNEWFSKAGYGSSCRFYSRWEEFHRLRLYARAEQPIGKYKSALAVDGDLSHINLDFTPVAIIPKFVDIVVNGMSDREMSIKAFSQDIISAEKRSKFQERIEADMISRDFLKATQEQFGVDAFNVDPEKLPEDSEELGLYMNLNYKPGIEIAEEIAIDTILQENKYLDTSKMLDYDACVLGMEVAKHDFLKGNGIQVEYVDAANYVHSYSEDPFFRDKFYDGEVKQIHINELIKINPDITPEKLEEISKMSDSWLNYWPTMRPYDLMQKDTVAVLYFGYKTTKNFVFKRKTTKGGVEKLVPKSDDFTARPEDPFDRVSIRKDVWYNGVMVLGSNELIKWELSSNMVRPKSATQHAVSNYIACAPRMYKGRIGSLVSRMIPFADAIQLTHLKLQQVKSRIVPDGIFIDADGLSEVDIGTGAAYTPEDALRLYLATGSVVGRSLTQDGEFNHGKIPIQEISTNSGQGKMAALVNDYNHNLNMIRDVTGLNEARDASTPDSDSLVGLQKLAALNSNTATRHILDSRVFVTRSLAECVSLRIADVLQYSETREDFAMKIGKYNMEILNEIKDLYLYNFGIFIELSPDEEQRQMLEQNIQMALNKDQIDLEDAIDIRLIKNIKQANEMLKIKRRRRMKQAQEREDAQVQMQAQVNQESQAAAHEAKMIQIQADAQAKISVKMAEGEEFRKNLVEEARLKSELMDKEFGINMQLKGLDVDGQLEKVRLSDKAKDERVDRQNTQMSEMIDQRQRGLPPKDFESTNDNLDDLDLGSFDPK